MKALAVLLIPLLTLLVTSATWAEDPVARVTGWEAGHAERITSSVDAAVNGDFLGGQVLVKLRAGTRSIQSENIMQSVSAVRIATDQQLGWEVWSVNNGTELDAVNALRGNGLVQFAEPNYYQQYYRTPNDTYFDWQSYLEDINLEQAWDISTGADTVKVAVVDSGVYSSHADLAGKLLPGKNVANEGLSTEDFNGHGTFIAGVIGASSNNGAGISGVSWGAKLLPVKDTDIITGNATVYTAGDGIRWAADNGAKVINVSSGSQYPSQYEQDAITYAYSKGALVVVAAGNCGGSNYALNGCLTRNPVIYPAADANVLAVGSYGPSGLVSSFSSYGSYVDISAPGEYIASTLAPLDSHSDYLPGTFFYGQGDGTSFAAPIVAGVASLVWSVNPSLTVAQVGSIIVSTARDAGAAGKDDYYGWGKINAYAALQSAQQTLGTLTPTPTATPSPTAKPTATPFATPTRPPDFQDDFVDNRNNWDLTPLGQVTIQGGKLQIDNQTIGTSIDTVPARSQVFPDLVYETEMQKTGGPNNGNFGLQFGNNNGAFYAFLINGNGQFALMRWPGAAPWTELKDWTSSSGVNLGSALNRLRVVANGNSITLYANDQLLSVIQDSNSKSGRIGVMVGSYGVQASFGRVRAWSASQTATPTPTAVPSSTATPTAGAVSAPTTIPTPISTPTPTPTPTLAPLPTATPTPLPAVIIIQPTPGTTTIVPIPGNQGNVYIPTDAGGTSSLQVVVNPVPAPTTAPTGVTLLSALQISFTNLAGNSPVTDLSQDVTIEMSYAGLGLTADQINHLVIYNATRSEYLPTAIDASRQYAIARTRRFSTFALAQVTVPIPRAYMPITTRSLSGGW